MDAYKTQLDSKRDLTLYIESLFQREDDAELETKTQAVIETDTSTGHAEVELIDTKAEENVLAESDVPLWAQTPFKCLLAEVAGMKFIVPATSVSFIELVEKDIIRIPLEADAFQGVISLRGKSIAVIDLYTLVAEGAPVNHNASSEVTSNHIEHVIVMEKGSYALACDQVSEMITLDAEDVRWNKAERVSEFYAGVAKDYLCPLIDIDNLFQTVSAMSFVQSLDKNNY